MIRSFNIRVLLLPSILLLASCHTNNPAAKRYPFHGRIESIDQSTQSALINADAIPGFMDAMAMSYKAKPADALNNLSPGDVIAADVLVTQDPPDYWLENVKVISHAQPAAQPSTTQHIPAPGDEVPDFRLTNQDGQRISLKQYRGQTLLITFIYTRCPFPDFCPRVTANFVRINDQLASDPTLSKSVRLLSISIDPVHDTPKALRDYGLAQAHGNPAIFDRWQFAVSTPADLPKIAAYFALTYEPDKTGVINHTLSTAVVGPDGKIAKWYHGSDWQPSDLMRDTTAALSISNQPDMSRKTQ